MYGITYSKQAQKMLLKISRNLAKRIRDKLHYLSQNPHQKNNNIKQLIATKGYRLRVGDWRIIYELNEKKLEILIIRIAARGEVYE